MMSRRVVAGIGILALLLAIANAESAADATSAPNPSATGPKRRALVVTAALEHFTFLSGSGELGFFAGGDNTLNLPEEKLPSVFFRLAGMAACFNRDEPVGWRRDAWAWLEKPMRGTIKGVELLPNDHPVGSRRYSSV